MALDMNWLKDEKRIIWRVIWMPLGRILWWMDGMDLRRPFIDPQTAIVKPVESSITETSSSEIKAEDNESQIEIESNDCI